MSEVWIIVKHTVRLLLRNRAFQVMTIVLPILSVIILNLHDTSDPEIVSNQNQVYTMEDMSDQICYDAKYTVLPVKIYDNTGTDLGNEFAKELATAGMFQVFYTNTSPHTEEEIQKDIVRCSERNKVSAILLLNQGLEHELRKGKIEHGVIFYDSKNDERTELFHNAISQVLGSYMQIASAADETTDLVSQIQTVKSKSPTLTEEKVEFADENRITYDMKKQSRKIGYVFSIVTIGFLFSGVLIADTVIKERVYKVYNRFQMTDLTALQYIIAKYIVGLLTVILQTGIIALALELILKQKYAITNLQLLINIAAIGLVFNTLSLCIGILCNNLMSANFLAYTFWSISGLMSGSYFPLDDANRTIRSISNLMPQKWALSTVKMLMQGKPRAYGVLAIATIAFLIIIGTVGVIGAVRSIKE